MWQFQWILSLIPDALLIYIYSTILCVGLVLYFGSKLFKWIPFKWIPLLGQYKFLSEFLGVILTASGLFLLGGYAVEESWRDKVKQVQEQVEKAEAESKEFNNQLDTLRKQKQKVRVEYYATVKERIVEKEKIIDAKCTLDPSVAQILNEAATNPLRKGTVIIEEIKK